MQKTNTCACTTSYNHIACIYIHIIITIMFIPHCHGNGLVIGRVCIFSIYAQLSDGFTDIYDRFSDICMNGQLAARLPRTMRYIK